MDISKRISGALYDFAGFLTTRKEATTFSSHHSAAPAVQLLEQFMASKKIELADPDWTWHEFCIPERPDAEEIPSPEKEILETRVAA